MCQIRTPLSIIKTIIASFYPSYFIEDKYISWMYPQLPKLKFIMQESGYFHLQATKPDTIGIYFIFLIFGLINILLIQ